MNDDFTPQGENGPAYITEQFTDLGHRVASVTFYEASEVIIVSTDRGCYQMEIGSDDDSFVFVSAADPSDVITFPFEGDRAMGL